MELTNKYTKIEIIEPTLLALEEYNKYCSSMPLVSNDWWWLQSPGDYKSHAVCAYGNNAIYEYGSSVNCIYGIRPALKIKLDNVDGLKIKDEFCFHGYQFTIISENLAICNAFIGKSQFSNNFNNDFNQSVIKEKINKWFNSKN